MKLNVQMKSFYRGFNGEKKYGIFYHSTVNSSLTAVFQEQFACQKDLYTYGLIYSFHNNLISRYTKHLAESFYENYSFNI